MISVPFGPKSKEWELQSGSICAEGCDPLSEFQSGTLAREWLRLLKGDHLRIDALRKLVGAETASTDVYRRTLPQLLDEVASALRLGRMHVHSAPTRNRRKFYFLLTHSGSSSTKSQADGTTEPNRKPQSQTTSAPKKVSAPTEKAFLHPEADQPAIATVLKAAAANGTPFCQECMKAGIANA